MTKFKPQFRRLLFIDKKITAGNYPNCTTLAGEWETSTKTIQRDIDYLKSQLDAPLAYDNARRGYYYTEPNYKLPAIDIRESDLFAVFIAEKVLKQYENSPIYSRLVKTFDKIAGSLPEKVSVSASWIDSRFSLIPESTTRIDEDIWDTVLTALREQKTLTIQHQVPGWETPTPRDIDPYHMVSYKGQWYILGFCHYKKGVRTFGLSRIKNAKILENRFQIPEDFNFEKIAGAHFGIIWGDKEYKVRIKFMADQAPYVRERDWHPAQSIKENKDGSIVLSFKTNHLYELKRWILSWGAGAKVLGPKELVDDIREELQNIAIHYGTHERQFTKESR